MSFDSSSFFTKFCSVDLLDAASDNGPIFFPGKTWVSDNKAMSRAMVTFHKDGNCDKCLGNMKTDAYDMIIAGWGRGAVNWGNKDVKKCFEQARHAFYGVQLDPQLNHSDDLACVLYQSLSKFHNNAKEWPNTTVKPPPSTQQPTFFEERPDKIQEGLKCTQFGDRTDGDRIIGGVNANQGSYPWQIYLQIQDGEGGSGIGCFSGRFSSL